jgi:hypothetical protein
MEIIVGNGSTISNFQATVEKLPDDCWKIWYSKISGPFGHWKFNIGYAIGALDDLMFVDAVFSAENISREDGLNISNLPDGWMPAQPVHIALPGGRFRLYFWAHGPEDHVVRFLAAESDDGINYRVRDPKQPCLYHYADRAAPLTLPGIEGLVGKREDKWAKTDEPGAPEELICNDATMLNRLSDGSYELYSAAIHPVPKSSPRYIAHDNAAGYCRYIRRFASEDGLYWRLSSEFAPMPQDPPEVQFYHLSVTTEDGGKVGLLGYYDVKKQTMDMERCLSNDGKVWRRPEPGSALVPREDGEMQVYPPSNLILHDGKWHLFYTSCNYTHNRRYCSGAEEHNVIKLAVFDAKLFS